MNIEEKTEEIRSAFPVVNHSLQMINKRLALKCIAFIIEALAGCNPRDDEQIENYLQIKDNLLKLKQ